MSYLKKYFTKESIRNGCFDELIRKTINSAIAVLQKKFGRKTPISVFFSSDGKLEKIEIGKDLTTTEKKWISDKFPELST